MPGYTKLGDPNYRWYNCNLEAPKIKCRVLNVEVFNNNGASDGTSGTLAYSGFKPMSTVHTFTPTDIPRLSNDLINGELVLYLTNGASGVGNVTMSTVNKTPTSGCQCTIYQRIGTMTSVDAASTGNTSFTITISPAAECRWRFQGY